jgi:hypothetical protein
MGLSLAGKVAFFRCADTGSDMMETDYLVKGAGASALAFVDVMLRETDATFATSIGVTRQAGIGTTLIHSCACINRPHITAFLRVSLAAG